MFETSAFAGKWPVDAKYECATVRGVEVVRPKKGGQGRWIDPGAFPRIAWEFAAVKNRSDLLGFVHRYGLLGYARLHREAKLGGDPVNWALDHARRLAAAFEIVELIPLGAAQVREELRGVLRPVGSFGVLYDADWPEDPIRVAWHALSHLINNQIRGLWVEVSEQSLTPAFRYNTLLQVIYFQLAGELEGLNLRRCDVCRQFFRAKRADAQTCSARCRMKMSRARSKGPKRRKR